MIRALYPITRGIERCLLLWALRELHPSHPAVPAITVRLADDSAPSPMDPADSIVTGACIVAALALLAMSVMGWLDPLPH